MIFLKAMLLLICFGALASAAATVIYDIFLAFELNRILRRERQAATFLSGKEANTPPAVPRARPARPVRRAVRWNAAAKWIAIAAISGMAGLGSAVVPDGHAEVRIIQISGRRPGTLHAGTHLIFASLGRVQLSNVPDRVFSTAAVERGREKPGVLNPEAREVKRAEGDAQSRPIQARAESDWMPYTLPLKQKQIEQARPEAQTPQAATIQNAEAEAQAKGMDGKAGQVRRGLMAEAEANAPVVHSKAEEQRRNRLADADASQIRVTAKTNEEQLEPEAATLKSNPLPVQYADAPRLSDRLPIRLMPSGGKFSGTDGGRHSATAASGEEGAAEPPAKNAVGKK